MGCSRDWPRSKFCVSVFVDEVRRGTCLGSIVVRFGLERVRSLRRSSSCIFTEILRPYEAATYKHPWAASYRSSRRAFTSREMPSFQSSKKKKKNVSNWQPVEISVALPQPDLRSVCKIDWPAVLDSSLFPDPSPGPYLWTYRDYRRRLDRNEKKRD